MRKLAAILLMLASTVCADETIPFNTGTGKAKISESGTGTVAKPYDFSSVTTTGISGGGGGAPAGLTGQTQYKFSASAFGGIPTLTYDGGTTVLTLAAGTKFSLVDPTDLTKKVRIVLSGITTGTTRNFTMPNADFTGVIPVSATTNQFVTNINSAGTQFKLQPTDAMLSTSDITTNNATTAKHGFVKKLPNDATLYYDGTGNYTLPAGGGGAPGGSTTQLQRNNAGAFGGVSTLTSDGTVVTQKGGTNYLLVDPTDATKKAQFTLSGITTATTRTVTVPNANSNFVIPLTATASQWVRFIDSAGTQTRSQPTFADVAGILDPAQNNIPIGKTLYVDASNGVNLTATPDRLDKPYATLTGAAGAIADASAGDQIVVGPGTFTETGAITPPQNVAITGSGAGITTLVTASGFKPATGDKISGFTMDARTASNASFSFAIGLDSSDTAATDVTIEGVELLGNTDGFYWNKAGTDRIAIYDCTVTTTFDTVFLGNLSGSVDFYNCNFNADGSIGGAGVTSGFNVTAGTANVYGGTVTLSNGVLEARGVRVSAGTVNVHNVTFNVSATTSFDLHQSSTGVLANDKNIRSNRAALVTSGTITQYVNMYEGNLGLSDITTANVSTTKHGLVKKLPNDPTLFLDGQGNFTAPGATSFTPGTGIDITTGTISVSPGVIDDQLEDTAPTLDDFMLTVNTTGDILQKVSLQTLADNLSLDTIFDDSSGFGAQFDVSALTANRAIFIPDAASTTVRASNAPAAQVATGIGTNGVIAYAKVGALDLSTAELVKTNSSGIVASAVAGTDYLSTANLSNTAYDDTTWNSVTTISPSKNALRDYFHIFDPDGNGQINVLDLGVAGIVKTNSSGVVATATAGTDYVAVGGALGTPSSGTATNITGLPIAGITGLGTGVGTALAVANNAAGGYSPIDGTATLTNKTLSSSTNTVGDGNTYSHDLTAIPNQTGGWSEYFVTGSDFTTSSTSLVAITGMTSGTLTGGAVYEFEVHVRLLNAADTAGMKIGFAGGGTGSAATVFCTYSGNTTSATAASTAALNAIDPSVSAALVSYSTGEGTIFFKGFFTARTTGTDTMIVEIAKVTSNTATVRVGSVLRIRKAHT